MPVTYSRSDVRQKCFLSDPKVIPIRKNGLSAFTYPAGSSRTEKSPKYFSQENFLGKSKNIGDEIGNSVVKNYEIDNLQEFIVNSQGY